MRWTDADTAHTGNTFVLISCVGLSDGIAPDGHFAAHNPQEPQVCEAPGISGIVPYSR